MFFELCLYVHFYFYRNLSVQNQELEVSEKSRDSTASAYSAFYPTTGIPVSKNGVRHDIPFIMQVRA